MTSNTDPNKVLVQPVCTYAGEDGFKHPNSEPYVVSRGRAAELKANGLVRDADDAGDASGQKRAPDAANKKAPDPQNKARAK